MAGRKYWVVEVSFPLDSATMIAETKKVQEIVDRPPSGAGAGFGMRDVDWTCDTKAEATRIADKLRKAGYTRVHVNDFEDMT